MAPTISDKITSEQLHSLLAAVREITIKEGSGSGNSGITPLISRFNSQLDQVRKLLVDDSAALATIADIDPIRQIQERLDASYHRTAKQQLLIDIPSLLHALASRLAPPPEDRPSAAATVFEVSPNSDPPDTEREDVTQLFMRRVLDADLPRWFEVSTSTGTALACIVLDIDHFKAFNEEYGHDKGDEVLRAVSLTIRTVVRARGRAYRWGQGDELVILLPNCTATEAAPVAERLRSEVRALNLQGVKRPITLSAGIASVPGEAATADDLRARADAALGRAKQAGRDRVHVDSQMSPDVTPVEERASDDEIQQIAGWLGSCEHRKPRGGRERFLDEFDSLAADFFGEVRKTRYVPTGAR